ncbi:hypothetical protein J7W19_29195 [Streptomyces mobaraensis NBRC 13819 = DSM 40847]|uniref:Uncharacterized protein n=1 Tax=Streptomyces mobaraensis (strain ATCC 29032 / DSM 40847 / JCM 4168 / NBRC 13819 / NCIMB 11159 / IPCR 16-22) TaxID=1223523 RepID=M3BRX9_STRM1|nr:hypothetical protein [Streptomyces mobaraensis]EMF02435.1 hypothetical protein H340_01274 [Streptomyces mobaraensis NBRC 13819 = DSM 40847]QTT76915.1 hypothetical protein J7W19_29195 [Streptomyces mobaraensis NBRC 13819 = DSM 40847]
MTDYVFVFIASKNTAPPRTRVLWRVTRDEAKLICSDPRTAARLHMLCWTARPGIWREDWEWVKDNGRYDDVLSDLGVEPANEMSLA